MKAILKWAGGKSWLVPMTERIVKEVNPQLVAEPFAGGLNFSCGHKFKRVIANDLNPFSINFYRHVQYGFVPSAHPHLNNDIDYYVIRERLNSKLNHGVYDQEAAQDLWWLNHACYNGLMRVNNAGRFNVPFGRYKSIASPDGIEDFYHGCQKWEFINGSYTDLDMSGVDMLLGDPPYIDTFPNYSKGGAGFRDLPMQLDVADWFANFDIPQIICNTANRTLAKEYKNRGYAVYITEVQRSISRNSDGRKKVPEMIAFRGFGDGRRRFLQLVPNIKTWRI